MQAIKNKLPEITDRKIRNKWEEEILVDAANGIFPKREESNDHKDVQ
jgi:hypothetical protein